MIQEMLSISPKNKKKVIIIGIIGVLIISFIRIKGTLLIGENEEWTIPVVLLLIAVGVMFVYYIDYLKK